MPVEEGWRQSAAVLAEHVLPRLAGRSDRRPGSGSGRAGAAAGYGERGSGDLALPPSSAGRAQPISSRVLPFVSLTNLRTNGMESAAKTV